jgi:hypothetical protein
MKMTTSSARSSLTFQSKYSATPAQTPAMTPRSGMRCIERR